MVRRTFRTTQDAERALEDARTRMAAQMAQAMQAFGVRNRDALEVLDAKKMLGLHVHVPEREEEVIKDARASASKYGLTEDDAESLARLLITSSRTLQQRQLENEQ